MKKNLKNIKLLILDIDGIMTDGTKVYNQEGMPFAKRYNDKDFTKICKDIGVSKPYVKRFRVSNHDHFMSYYTDEMKEVIREFYKKDFELFGYNE